MKDRLTDLGGKRLLKNDSMNTFCEINLGVQVVSRPGRSFLWRTPFFFEGVGFRVWTTAHAAQFLPLGPPGCSQWTPDTI